MPGRITATGKHPDVFEGLMESSVDFEHPLELISDVEY
jgi:hypothetical protein